MIPQLLSPDLTIPTQKHSLKMIMKYIAKISTLITI